MNTRELSYRLETVAKYILKGQKLADIGSDHAYLPCYAVLTGLVPFAVAGEVVEGPYLSAKSHVQEEGLSKQISVRMGDGLEVIEPDEVDCVTIAGMGGALIANILESGKDKIVNLNRLILQPNISAISIRQWLIANGWQLINEEIIEEDGKIYEILVAEQGDPMLPYNQEDANKSLLLGPFLMKERNSAFQKKWRREMNNWERILENLKNAQASPENSQRKLELQTKIRYVEEVLANETNERT